MSHSILVFFGIVVLKFCLASCVSDGESSAHNFVSPIAELDSGKARLQLHKFRGVKSPREKLAAAAYLIRVKTKLRLHGKSWQDLQFDNSEIKHANEAVDFFEESSTAGRKYARDLPVDVHSKITKGVKRSLTKIVKEYVPPYSHTDSCIGDRYQEMKKTLGMPFLAKYGTTIIVAASVFEDDHFPLYYRRLAEHIDSSACRTRQCMLAKAYYLFSLSEYDTQEWKKRQRKSKKSLISDLENLGVKKGTVEKFVYGVASRWAECFFPMSINVIEKIKTDIALTCMENLKKYIQKKGSSATWGDIILPKDNPLLSKTDPWGMPYQVSRDIRGWKIRSGGPDMTLGTADDLVS